jgi:hypothetical protein
MKENIMFKNDSNFMKFYKNNYLKEHSHNGTICFHVFGTILGIAWIFFSMFYINLIWIILFPLIHALPGILGHKIFERNEDVGDIRITRKDFPLIWFIFANHILTYQILTFNFKKK